MTIFSPLQFTCTNAVNVYGIRNGIKDIIKRTSDILSLIFPRISRVKKSAPTISHAHRPTDPFDPSVAPVLIPLPIVLSILALLLFALAYLTTYFSPFAPYPYQPPPYLVTFLLSYPLVHAPRRAATPRDAPRCAATRLLAFRLFSNPTQPRYRSYSLPLSLPRYHTTDKSAQ